MKFKRNNQENIDLNQLLLKLKKEDTRYAQISKALQIIYLVLIPLYILITIMEYLESRDVNHIIGGGCFVLSFLIFVLFFKKYSKEYKFVDYSLPTIQMLKKAAYRYKPFQLRTIWILPAFVLMDLGYYFNSSFDFQGLSFYLFFIGIMIVAIFIGLIVWWFKYKPLRDNALSLIKEIEGE